MLEKFLNFGKKVPVECPACHYNFKVPAKYLSEKGKTSCANCGEKIDKQNITRANSLSEDEKMFINVIKENSSALN